MKRVPPNLLVGDGATDYAYENGFPLLPSDSLISPGAKDRWKKWTRDLEIAQQLERPLPNVDSREIAGLRNEAQPASPSLPSQADLYMDEKVTPGSPRTPERPASSLKLPSGSSSASRRRSPAIDDASPRKHSSLSPNVERLNVAEYSDGGPVAESHPQVDVTSPDEHMADASDHEAHDGVCWSPHRRDHIVDTVGAIAVDCFGNIAAASSSGGIGMKHRGRMGPAALVGIGTAVHPPRTNDKAKTSVACVTSGTGEHMATTTAASTCAERVYLNQKKSSSGSTESTFEDEAVRSFICNDFMGHPSIKHSHSAGAIGVMVVKKTMDGVYLYFGHNTESFALASMSTEDNEPHSVMSLRERRSSSKVHAAEREQEA